MLLTLRRGYTQGLGNVFFFFSPGVRMCVCERVCVHTRPSALRYVSDVCLHTGPTNTVREGPQGPGVHASRETDQAGEGGGAFTSPNPFSVMTHSKT